MVNDKDIQLYDVRGLVPYDIKELIELDALKMVTSQKTIVGMAISQYYADLTEKSSSNLRQKYANLCKKTQIFQENIEFLQKNNVFELKITQILAIFRQNMNSSSYDNVRELFFKELIDLILEYKLLYPDRIKKVDLIVKRYVNKDLYAFYLDEFLTVKKSGPLKVLHNRKKGGTKHKENLESTIRQNGDIPLNEHITKINIEDVDLPDAPLTVINDLLDNMAITPQKHWIEVVTNCKNYLKSKYVNNDDYDTTMGIFELGQKKLYRDRFEQVD